MPNSQKEVMFLDEGNKKALFVQLEKEQAVCHEDTGGFAEMGSQLSRSQ